jgi:hypothetical protein
MSTLLRRLALPLLALLLTAASSLAEEPNRNVRFGLPSPAKGHRRKRQGKGQG